VVPKNFYEAMEHPEVWMGPMEKEYGSLVGWEVWVLVGLPPGTNVIISLRPMPASYGTSLSECSGQSA
jgi:hypothetical protein